MKLKVVDRGSRKGRHPKNVTIVADKVNIVTRGNVAQPIGYNRMAGVRGAKREYQFSYDVKRPPIASVTGSGGTVEPPPEEPPAAQNLIQNSLGRLGRVLGGYAFDYARQALFNYVRDVNSDTQDFNTFTDPNLVDTFTPMAAPRSVEMGVGNDVDYVLGDEPGTVFGVNRGAQTLPLIAPNDQSRLTRSTQFPNYRPAAAQTTATGMQNAAAQTETGMQNAAEQTGGGVQDNAAQAGFNTTEAAQQTDTIQGVGLGTQTTQPTAVIQPRSAVDTSREMRSFGIGVRPDIASQATQTSLQADMTRLFEEQQRLLNNAGVSARELLAMNQRLGEMFQEAQSDYATVESMNINICSYIGTMLDSIIGDPRWRDIIPPDLSTDEQVRYMFSLVESRDPRFRNFVRDVGGFADRLKEVTQAETQTDFVPPTSGTRSRSMKSTWQTGTQTEANPPSGLSKRKEGPSQSLVQQRHRTKRVKTSAATGPPIKVRIPKPAPLRIRVRRPGPVQGPTMPRRIANRPPKIQTTNLPGSAQNRTGMVKQKRAEPKSAPGKNDTVTNVRLKKSRK